MIYNTLAPGCLARQHDRMCSSIRTTDTVAPIIMALLASWTPPSSLTISANVSKPGTIRYLARRTAEAPPSDNLAVLDIVAANNLGAANFTGSMVVAHTNVAVVGGACIAEGDAFVLYAVAQDGEGKYPGRCPNNSTMSRWAGQGWAAGAVHQEGNDSRCRPGYHWLTGLEAVGFGGHVCTPAGGSSSCSFDFGFAPQDWSSFIFPVPAPSYPICVCFAIPSNPTVPRSLWWHLSAAAPALQPSSLQRCAPPWPFLVAVPACPWGPSTPRIKAATEAWCGHRQSALSCASPPHSRAIL